MSKLKTAAKFVGGILGIVLFTSALAKYVFNKKVENEVEELLSHAKNSGEIVTQEDLAELPSNVRKWLEYTGVIGQKKLVSVHLKQEATLRLDADKPWLPVKAEQYFTIDDPGFIWRADIKAAPLFHISSRERYIKGRGHMLIKILSLFTIADSKGKEIDQGTLLRYLVETMWFPTAAISDYLTWEEINQSHSKVNNELWGITASGVFTFNEQNQVFQFEAERYGEFNGEIRLETWSIPVYAYKEFEGIKIPTQGEVTWKLAAGDFNWLNFEVVDMEYKITSIE